MKLLTMLRRYFAGDTDDVPPLELSGVHELLAFLQEDGGEPIPRGHA